MKNKKNEWRLMTASINPIKMHIFGFIVFILYAVLFVIIGLLRKTDELNLGAFWIGMCIYWSGSCLFFLRIFYGRENPRFSKTLPCSKKMYTKNISVIFELISSLVIIAYLTTWFILYNQGKQKEFVSLLFFMTCIIHFLISIFCPLVVKDIYKERWSKYGNNRIGKENLSFIIKYFTFVGIFVVFDYLFHIAVKNNLVFLFSTGPVYWGICIFILAASFVCNRLLFNRAYKRR